VLLHSCVTVITLLRYYVTVMEFALFFLINVVRVLKYAILVRVLMSWIQTDSHGTIYRFIHESTEPFLGALRKILPSTGMIDLSPLLAFFILDFLEIFLAGTLSA